MKLVFAAMIAMFSMTEESHAQINVVDFGDQKVLKAFFTEGASAQEVTTFGSYAFEEIGRNYIDVSDLDLKIVGRGIKNRYGEALAFACVGAPEVEGSIEPSCQYLRAVFYRPDNKKVFAFGWLYFVSHQNFLAFFKSLKETSKQEGFPAVTDNRYLAFYSDAISSRDGWNWSTNPKKISQNRMLSMLSDIQGADSYFFKKESRMGGLRFIFREMKEYR